MSFKIKEEKKENIMGEGPRHVYFNKLRESTCLELGRYP